MASDTDLDEGGAGEEYAKLIAEQLDEERKVKSSLEQRGITVITTSGTLVTLLFALVAVVTKDETFDLASSARWGLYLALCLFVLAAIVGLITNMPRRYDEANVEDLAGLIKEDYWAGSASIGSRRSSEVRVKVLRSARETHKTKAYLLQAALALEVAAVAALATAVVQILWG